MQTRRDFGKWLATGLPLAAYAAKIDSTVNGVRLGVMTYSFRDFPRTPGADNIDAIVKAVIECGAGEIELYSPNVEPAPQPDAKNARELLRQWRLATPAEHFKAVKKKFDDARIRIYALTINYRDDFTDPEIDKTFEQAKQLGALAIASSTQLSFAPRLVPFAEKHKMAVAFHGHSNLKDPNEFATPESFQKAMSMSKFFKVNLDIGHFTAANYDAVAYIQEHHDRITHLHMKDRKKNDGPNTPWGQGDTPLTQVLQLLKNKRYPIPALIEYEYAGTGTSIEEVKKCMAYMRKAVA